MLDLARIKSQFSSKYIPLNDDWLQQCLEWINTEYPNISNDEIISKIYDEWLNLDLQEVEIPILPPHINEFIEKTIKEPMHLQLLYVVDISKPKYLQLKSIRSRFDDHTEDTESCGMLKLVLTDGVQEISAIEYKKIEFLNLELQPGLKIFFKPPINIRRGQIMLEPGMIELRGGAVQELEEPNCIENILAAALKLPLLNTPRNASEVSVNDEIVSNTNNLRNNTNSNGIIANQTDFPDEFDDILTDDFLNNHLESLRNERQEFKASEPFDDEINNLLDQENEIFSSLPANYESQQNIANANTPVTSKLPQVSQKFTEKTEIPSQTSPVKRPIMKIEKLNKIKHNVTKGTFKIEMEVMDVVKRLKVEDNEYLMKVLAADDSGDIEVQIGSQIITDWVQIQPWEFASRLSSGEVADKQKIAKLMENLASKLNDFHAFVIVSVEANKDPVVTEILEIFPVEEHSD